MYSSDNINVAGTHAEITGKSCPNFFLGGGGVLPQEFKGGEEHAGRAKATLQGMVFLKSLLEWMEPIFSCKTFDGGDLRPVGLHREQKARPYGLSVHQHGACPADSMFAAHMSSGES